MNAASIISPIASPCIVAPGTRLGSYEILLCIARGGMGSVWAARQHGARGFQRLVALKTVLPELENPAFETMFLDEARVASRIHHPNVCEIFELIEDSGVLALSMEWVDGVALSTVLSHGALAPRVAAHIVAQAACGLHAAHELQDESGVRMDLVHRDVTPQNILISRQGHVKVADFGIAKALGGSRETTAIGTVKGKLAYMSPEQARGAPLDRRSDIFSLGVVLYMATVGEHPIRREGEAQHQLLLRLLEPSIAPPSRKLPGYPAELEAIVMRALSHKPEERFASADEMRRQLTEWIVASGPLLGEQDIAQAVSERVAPLLRERTERIQACLRPNPRSPDDVVARLVQDAPTEVTFVPTTNGLPDARMLVKPEFARDATRTLGVALVAALVGGAAAVVWIGAREHGSVTASAAPPPAIARRATVTPAATLQQRDLPAPGPAVSSKSPSSPPLPHVTAASPLLAPTTAPIRSAHALAPRTEAKRESPVTASGRLSSQHDSSPPLPTHPHLVARALPPQEKPAPAARSAPPVHREPKRKIGPLEDEL